MRSHLMTHSLAELPRFEIRQDPDQVPDDHRPLIIRDLCRGLLGTVRNGRFELGPADRQPMYSIDEALAIIGLYRRWSQAKRRAEPNCGQH
jgi:hypothetical protein